jgi:hypothetical protein
MKVLSGGLSTAAVIALFLGVSAMPTQAGPPLPFHTIEGVGGGAITPMAYLVNPEPSCALFKKPAVAMSFVNLDDKNLQAMTVTEMIGERIEFGYAANRLGLGDLPDAIQAATPFDIETSDLWLHHFNLRLLCIEENTEVFGLPMPAVTAGVHFKVNDGISGINQRLNGALSAIGYDRASGVDFTLTATKMFKPGQLLLPMPIIMSAGLRESQGAQLGLLGFGDEYHATFEGNIACFLTERIILAYEYRQKASAFGEIPGLIGEEDDWHAIDAAFIVGPQTTLCAGWGNFGLICNNDCGSAWWLQLKHNF